MTINFNLFSGLIRQNKSVIKNPKADLYSNQNQEKNKSQSEHQGQQSNGKNGGLPYFFVPGVHINLHTKKCNKSPEPPKCSTPTPPVCNEPEPPVCTPEPPVCNEPEPPVCTPEPPVCNEPEPPVCTPEPPVCEEPPTEPPVCPPPEEPPVCPPPLVCEEPPTEPPVCPPPIEPPVCEEPPVEPPVEPPIEPPCPEPPQKVYGSLNISGDPIINVTTPGVTTGSINFNEPVGTPINLLTDPDNNFSVNTELHVVNDDGNTGLKQLTFTANNHQVQFANDGSLIVDGQNRGNINSSGLLGTIDLGNGVTVQSAMMDDGGGKQTERFVLTTPEYQVTAARREPNATKAYFDVNIAETTAGSADNATGMNLPGVGTTGIDDLLRQEPT